MKTLLTVADIEYLLTQQAKLDKDIREKKGISWDEWQNNMTSERSLAISVEIHEFINECHDLWKYWKSKPVDKEKILDEAVDVIHFIMLHYGKVLPDLMPLDEAAPNMMEALNFYHSNFNDLPVTSEALEQMILKSEDAVYILYIVLKTLDYYNFTSKDIIDQYHRKNKINFERLQGNY